MGENGLAEGFDLPARGHLFLNVDDQVQDRNRDHWNYVLAATYGKIMQLQK